MERERITTREGNMMKWMKLNIFSIITFMIMSFGGIVYLGNIPNRIIAAESQISINSVRITQLERSINDFIITNNTDHTFLKTQVGNIDRNVTSLLEKIINKGFK